MTYARTTNDHEISSTTGSERALQPGVWNEMSTEAKNRCIGQTLMRLGFREEPHTLSSSLKLQCMISITRQEISRIHSVDEFEEILDMKLDNVKEELGRFIIHLKNKIRQT